MKLPSPIKFFVLYFFVTGPIVFLGFLLTTHNQTIDNPVSPAGPDKRAGVFSRVQIEADSASVTQSRSVPKDKTGSIFSAGPTPIAVTGFDQALIATPTTNDATEIPVEDQATSDVPVSTDPSAADFDQKSNLPSLESFIQQVSNGQKDVLSGVYAAEVFALEIVQQPDGEASFISEQDGTATQFRSAAMYGVVGLLAHNFLSGELFHHLKPEQEITLIYGDGRLEKYRISRIVDFERLTISDLQSDFRELDTDQTWTVDEVFFDFYSGEPHLTLQTCIEKDGVWNWGVRFIQAEPIN